MRTLIALTGSILAGALAAGSLSAAPRAEQLDAASAATTRASVATGGAQADFSSYAAGASADGRIIAFTSDATNLVPGDTNARRDVFVRDRRTGSTTRVSVGPAGAQAEPTADETGGSTAYGISGDGRLVVFVSDAPNLVGGDTNGVPDVFVHDRRTGATTRVSVDSRGRQANGPSGFAAISADGRYVAFMSLASNLVRGDSNRAADVFVRDLRTGHTTRASVDSGGRQGKGTSEGPALSADGRYVAFQSAAPNLVPGDTNRNADVFVRDRRTGRTTRVSVSSSGGQARGFTTNTGSNAAAISADGRYVAFHSDASNLVRGDTNRAFDIFVHDRRTGRTTRASVGGAGRQANGESLGPAAISRDGRYVAFASLASNLVPGDTNEASDLFVRDLRGSRTIRASRGLGASQADDGSFPGAFAAGGRLLVFTSYASNLVAGDTNRNPDVFVRDFGGQPR